ncbi:Calcium-binding ef-hand [Thalictrum thalictroides]|uniref:Calcium-binding ef-hand n=1 Tax=Thalictrum thalictroides TaxID=46969 RepID=A0A7J6WMN4_THATH|nr:Calcium-binding ef-hand [Thalictrum thalictroides]
MDSAKVLDDVKNVFLIFDMNGDGSISPQDLQKVLRNLGQSCSIAECRRMINGFDNDGDGMMDFEDFKVMMEENPIPCSKLGNQFEELQVKEVGDGNLDFADIVISPSDFLSSSSCS